MRILPLRLCSLLLTLLVSASSLAALAGDPKPAPQDKILFQRETFRYQGEGQRDPFQPLTKKRLIATGQVTVDISDLRLIGVMWGPDGNLALVEDSGGMGYVLRAGDRVAGGRVLSVSQDTVLFELTAYGTRVKVTLKLGGQGEQGR